MRSSDPTHVCNSLQSEDEISIEFVVQIRQKPPLTHQPAWVVSIRVIHAANARMSRVELPQHQRDPIDDKASLHHLAHDFQIGQHVDVESDAAIPINTCRCRYCGQPSVALESQSTFKSVSQLEDSPYIPLKREREQIPFSVATIGSATLVFAVFARLVPDASRAGHAEARAPASLPVSRLMSCDTVAADETEVSAARRSARHVIAPLGWEDLFFTARAFLVVTPLLKLLEHITCCGFLANVIFHSGNVFITVPAVLASMAQTGRTTHQSQSFLAEKLTADDPADAVPTFAIQTLLHWHSIFFLFLPPRLTETVIEQIPERPDIQLLFAPHRRVLVFVLKGSVEARRHAVAGAIITDPGRLGVSYPTWQFFKLILAAENTFKARVRHGFGGGWRFCDFVLWVF